METKTIYNKGKREWNIATGVDQNGLAVTTNCPPGGEVELPAAIADKFLHDYPKDFMKTKGTTGNTARQLKDAKIKIAAMESKIESLCIRIDELETENALLSPGPEEPEEPEEPAAPATPTRGRPRKDKKDE